MTGSAISTPPSDAGSTTRSGGEGVDPVVARQQAEWAKQIDAFRGSDLASRKLRLSRFLRGFNGAYSWTRCTPAADLDTLLATTPSPADLSDSGCTGSPDHSDILETIENAADDWQRQGYTSALAEVRDMANVGRALMEALPEGYSYNDFPSEIVTDLMNERDEALAGDASPDDGGAIVRAYFERGFICCAAWSMTKPGEQLSDEVIEHAWAHRDEGLDEEDMLPPFRPYSSPGIVKEAGEVEALRKLSDAATPGPWSWEQCGEKEDVPVVGIAFAGDDPDCVAPYEGEFRDDDAHRTSIAYDWASCDGHSPSANAAFAVAAVNFVRAVLSAINAAQMSK